MGELIRGLTDYFAFYNAERPHQSLTNQTPNRVYEIGHGGGAMIVDKFPKEAKPETLATPGQRCSAACEVNCAA
jgi:putative transposase